jgi:hypothetical protein
MYFAQAYDWYMDIHNDKNKSPAVFEVKSLDAGIDTTKPNMKIFYLIDAILILAILFMCIFVLPKTLNKTTTPSKVTQATTVKQSNGLGIPSSTNNPLNNNGSINSQVQYCTNPVNAALVC